MNKSTSFTIITSLTLILGLAGAIALVRTSQDTRSSAAFATATLSLLPSPQTIKVGEEMTVHFKLQNTKAAVNSFQTMFCYNKSQLELLPGKTAIAADFAKDIAKSVTDNGRDCYSMVVHGMVGISGPSIEPFNITFKALSEGSGKIEVLDGERISVGGENNADDKEITISTIDNLDYTITAAVAPPVTTDTKKIKAKLVLMDVMAAESNCMKQVPLGVVVLVNGVKTPISNVIAKQTGAANSDGIAIYEAEIPLTGISLPASNVALFLKGPSHLQMKYAVDGQSVYYNKPAGELSIDNDATKVSEFDFTKVPMLAGDMVGSEASAGSAQNGVIDAIDYTYIKAEIDKALVSNEYMKADLDGSCMVKARDASTFLKSLQAKQEQLY